MTHRKPSVPKEAEIDYQAKKITEDKLSSIGKKSYKKIKKLREELKATIPGREHTLGKDWLGYKDTEESKRIKKELKKEKKTQKWVDKHEDILEKRGVSGIKRKYLPDVSGSALARYEKKKLKRLGVYRKKKGGEVLEAPSGYKKTYSAQYKKKLKYN